MDKRKVCSTLNAELKGGRRIGNTTRQVDYAIQHFFAGDIVVFQDHHLNGEMGTLNKYLAKRFLERLENEFGAKNWDENQMFIRHKTPYFAFLTTEQDRNRIKEFGLPLGIQAEINKLLRSE